MTAHAIKDVAALEAAIGAFPPAAALKVIPYLDPGALGWIARSPLFFAAFADDRAIGITIGAEGTGRVEPAQRELRIPLALLDDTRERLSGTAFASLFLLPGIGETLRVNGTVVGTRDDCLRIAVTECYGHCAKALIRSEFWQGGDQFQPDVPAAFLASVRLMILATASGALRADLSPKGDPAGLMVQMDGGTLLFADRPGNRRLDSFRNIVERSEVAMALLIPGVPAVAMAHGHAGLSTDPAMRARFAVGGKTPAVVAQVDVQRLELRGSAALARATPWAAQPVTGIDPARLFVEHVRRNRTEGAAAALIRASLSAPGATGLLRRGLEKDYKDNLY